MFLEKRDQPNHRQRVMFAVFQQLSSNLFDLFRFRPRLDRFEVGIGRFQPFGDSFNIGVVHVRRAGKRVFNVALQGKTVLKNLDVFKQSGGTNRGIMREFKGVRVNGTLVVTLKAAAGRPVISGVEVFAEP